MDTDLKNEMLITALAEMIAERDGLHPAHAHNRVRLAVEIAARADAAPTHNDRVTLVNNATRIDGQPVSTETKRLVRTLVGR